MLTTVVVVAVGTASASASAIPAASLTVNSGPPTTAMTINATGFDPGAAVDIYYETTDIALAVSSSTGAISFATTVPASAQPGTHWFTLVERAGHAAAQARFYVYANWLEDGVTASGRGFNAFENTIDSSNVSTLARAWTHTAGGYGNRSPMAYWSGFLYLGDVNGVARSYARGGTLQWTASTGSNLQASAPTEYGGRVFFGASNGNVYAYSASCRTDGGVCTPQWTKSVGAAVSGDLTTTNGVLMVPTADGTIHQLLPATGAVAAAPLHGYFGAPAGATTRIAFDEDGSYFYGDGPTFIYTFASGGAGQLTEAGTVSPIAALNGTAYFTTTDGKATAIGDLNWTVTSSSASGCAPAPAVAGTSVYVGGCAGLSALSTRTGAVQWSVSTPGQVYGVSVANGIVYACVGQGVGFAGNVVAYIASYGGELWTGGACNDAPVVVDGAVYASYSNVSRYTLTAAQTTARHARAGRRPDPRRLRPDRRLHARR